MVGDFERYNLPNPATPDYNVIKNWAGAATMIMNNIYNWAALGCIL